MQKQFILSCSLVILALGIIAVSFTSCSKSTPNANAQFVGTYPGGADFGSGNQNDTAVVTAGSSASAITILLKNEGTQVAATISGDTITIGSQSATLKGGAITVASGTGNLNGSTLAFQVSATIGSSTPVNFQFSGTK